MALPATIATLARRLVYIVHMKASMTMAMAAPMTSAMYARVSLKKT